MKTGKSNLQKLALFQIFLHVLFFPAIFIEETLLQRAAEAPLSSNLPELIDLIDNAFFIGSADQPLMQILVGLSAVIFLIYLASLIALYFAKSWAKKLYLISLLLTVISSMIFFPTVSLPLTYFFEIAVTLVDGMLIYILFISAWRTE